MAGYKNFVKKLHFGNLNENLNSRPTELCGSIKSKPNCFFDNYKSAYFLLNHSAITENEK